MFTRSRGFALTAFLLGILAPLRAQVFKVQGGTSTLFGASGASVDMIAPNYSSEVGLGMLDGNFQFGAQFRTKIHKDTLTIGDDSLNFDLPTDVFGTTHYFLARGASLRWSTERDHFMLLGGATSQGFSTPFFIASRTDKPLTGFYFDRELNSDFRLVSRNLVSSRQTSIQALEWSPLNGLKAAVAGGIGAGQRYTAASLSLERETISARASYIAAGDQFQRIQVPALPTSELEKGNFNVTYRPSKLFNITGGHENILQPPFRDQPLMRASVNEIYSGFNVSKFSFGGGLFDSKFQNQSTVGTNFYVTRPVTQRVTVNGNFFQSRPSTGGGFNTFTGSVRTIITQKLTITEDVTNSNGQTSFSTGGEILTNRFNVMVNHQTVYVPLRPKNPFQQVMGFNARINLVRNLQVNAASYVDPLGKSHYTFGLSTFLYRFAGGGGYGEEAVNYRFPKFAVKGVVVDASDNPIEGVAVHIGNQVAYSDNSGQFTVRESKRGPFALQIAFEEFIAPGTFQVVEAPASVTADGEDAAEPIRIVLRRVVTQSPAKSQ